eukprot:m.115845 g.115845  ORF g.115845 m.115845 type:complete len:59 (+) comp37569_c0_seq2:486-662(+)
MSWQLRKRVKTVLKRRNTSSAWERISASRLEQGRRTESHIKCKFVSYIEFHKFDQTCR